MEMVTVLMKEGGMKGRRTNGDLPLPSAMALLHAAQVQQAAQEARLASLFPQPRCPGRARCWARVPLKKAALSGVLSPALRSQTAKHCRLPRFPTPAQAPHAFFCGPEAAVRAATHQASEQFLGQTWCSSGCVYPENSRRNVKMPLRGPLPCESSPDHHSLCGPFLPLAVPCMVQLVVKCSYTLSLP